MTPTRWSLEAEFIRLTGMRSLAEALQRLGLAQAGSPPPSIRTDETWRRGGSETFIYRFWITYPGRVERGYLFKACVPFVPGVPAEDVLRTWIDRRLLLARNGISVPTLIATGPAMLVEEWVRFSLYEAVTRAGSHLRRLQLELARLAGTLTRLGFRPTAPYADLRSRGTDVVFVDFGEDLGAPSLRRTENVADGLFSELLSALSMWGVRLDAATQTSLLDAYARAVAMPRARRTQDRR